MANKKLERCPLCGGKTFSTYLCNVKCENSLCNYEVQEDIHSEICVALKHYRKHIKNIKDEIDSELKSAQEANDEKK